MAEQDILANRVALFAAVVFGGAFVFSAAVVMFAPWTEGLKWLVSVTLWPVAAVVFLLAVFAWNRRTAARWARNR